MTLGHWLDGARARLRAAGALDWAIDPEWMACEALSLRRSALPRSGTVELDAEALIRLNGWLARREGGEPLQYVLGNAHFMGHVFLCDRRSLIPRPDTEALCERAIEFLRIFRRPRVLDLCCGGGAIGITVAKARPDADVVLADLSADALALAGENAAALGARVALRRGDLFQAVGDAAFRLIACNPPYVRSGDVDGLERELAFEPRMALDGGADGLDFYRRIAAELGGHLLAGGAALLEVGDGQAEDVRELFSPVGRAAVHPDLSGSLRVVAVYKGV
ncbi:MAG: peptide chain release factor N(5)-glutamine methyltransferase [Clostridiales bacterium]|nr:peptide chain release factor N(5)-glutamine methyltransferase [Clostridiales bacterium]